VVLISTLEKSGGGGAAAAGGADVDGAAAGGACCAMALADNAITVATAAIPIRIIKKSPQGSYFQLS
jgi:hypothetical protein